MSGEDPGAGGTDGAREDGISECRVRRSPSDLHPGPIVVCRLTAYVGEPLPLSTLVFGGSHPLYEQSWAPSELLSGTVNADGWGVVWYDGGHPARLARSKPLWHANGLERVLTTIRSPTALAAIRNATTGLPQGEAGVAPIIFERWTFVLNGFVPSFRARHMRVLRTTLPDHLYGSLAGVSDTETLFLLAVAELERGASLREALGHVVELALERVGEGDECQLTMLLSDGEGLAVVRTSNRSRVNSLYRIDRGSLAPEGTLLASERLDADEGWTPIPERTVLELRRSPPAHRPDPSHDS
jgi:glutamine amidotransferase